VKRSAADRRARQSVVRRHAWTIAVGAAVVAALTWAGFAPIHTASRDQIFEIPKGTWASRMAGKKVAILPDHIRLTLGLRDILVLKNRDEVPQIFGPTLMMPGQNFRLPFERAAEYQFACTAHASGQMTIVVEPNPATPWARIRWRVRKLLEHSS
jgi:hypothetical protein